MSLRAELTGETVDAPGFAVLLPAGWQALDADLAGSTEQMDAALKGFPESTRVLLRARIGAMLASARAQSAEARVARVFAPSASSPDEYVPVNLVASWISAPSGTSIQQMGADLISRRGAETMDAGGSILRWQTDQTSVVEGGEVEVAGHGYLLPAPRPAATALMFRSQILRSAQGAIVSDEGVAAMSLVCDAIVASVRWQRAA